MKFILKPKILWFLLLLVHVVKQILPLMVLSPQNSKILKYGEKYQNIHPNI